MNTPTTAPTPVEPVGRDWLLAGGMLLVGLAAAASSFSGLFDLAFRTGWMQELCALLPLTVDAYAMTATRVWLAKSTRNPAARRWAKFNAIGAIAVSVAGNAIDHAVSAHVIPLGWPLVVAVSAIPPVVLGLLVHMAHLRTLTPQTSSPTADTTTANPQQGPSPEESAAPPPPSAPPTAPAPPKPSRRSRRPVQPGKTRQALPPGKTDAELIAAARVYAATGTDASATWLMKTFGIGTGRAARIRDAAQHSPEAGPALAPVPDTTTTTTDPDTDEESAA